MGITGTIPAHLDRKTGRFTPLPPRPIEIPIGPSIAYVPLSQGLYALIDRSDAAWVGRWNWHAMKGIRGDIFYAARNERLAPGKQRMIRLHAAILGLSGAEITADHINRNTLDNRRANLRPATRSQQCLNRRKRVTGTSRFVGVAKHKNGWRATASIGLGIFKTEEEARLIHDLAVSKMRECLHELRTGKIHLG